MVEQLKAELQKLSLPIDDNYVNNLILDNLSEEEYLSILRQIGQKEAAKVGIINHPKFLKTQEVNNLILKLIGLMEVSDNAEEFTNLLKKKKKPKKPSDFDKILKGILQVPKEKREDISSLEKPSE